MIAAFLLGVISLAKLRTWWRRIWPLEEFRQHPRKLVWLLVTPVRFLAFLIAMVPLGPVAFVVLVVEIVTWLVLLPFVVAHAIWRWLVVVAKKISAVTRPRVSRGH